MSYIIFDTARPKEPVFDPFPLRPEVIDRVSKRRKFDIIVIGGGIHGATFARVASLNNLNVLLLERDDYASATSSRSSKMVHGGLRYLELFDFGQVFEGIKAREDLFVVAPHLAKPHPYFIPVKNVWSKLKLGLGLSLYDLFLKEKSRHHSWCSKANLPQGVLEQLQGIKGGFTYFDGIMNDTRLVIENVIAARQEGAQCLNYAEAVSIQHTNSGFNVVYWKDRLTGQQYESQTGVIINCTGPWAPFLGRVTPNPELRVKYSQGAHVIFNKPWNAPALFLPLPGRSRYYFVWPHFAGTLVGTTEREVRELERDPQPTVTEISEILGRLERDLPNSGLNKSSASYAFAGVRTLALRSGATDLATVSRKEIWSYGGGVLSLIGGKYTTAAGTALAGLKKIYRLASLAGRPTGLAGRALPGAVAIAAITEEFLTECARRGTPIELAERAILRLGAGVKRFAEIDSGYEPIGNSLLRGEVEIALRFEQAENIEDLMRRRLELEYLPGHGLEVVDQVAELLGQRRSGQDVSAQTAAYRTRLANLDRLIAES